MVRSKADDKMIALKIQSKSFFVKHQQVIHAISERRILGSIDFPFLIKLYFAFKDNDSLYFGMEYLAGGELYTHIHKLRKLTEIQTRFYAAQVVLGFEYLHRLDLIYRDLKPENIVLNERGYLKIVDFGFCKRVTGRTYSFCGTIEYLAPEIVESKGYGKGVDWWAFGVFIFEMASGVSPFAPKNKKTSDRDTLENIISGKYKCPKYFSKDFQNLIKNLLQRDISKRFGVLRKGIADIKEHKWFDSVDWMQLYRQEVAVPFTPKVIGPNNASNLAKHLKPAIQDQSPICLYEEEFRDF